MEDGDSLYELVGYLSSGHFCNGFTAAFPKSPKSSVGSGGFNR